MKMIIFGLCTVLGVMTFNVLAKLDAPMGVYVIVIAYALANGGWAFLAGYDQNKPAGRRRR